MQAENLKFYDSETNKITEIILCGVYWTKKYPNFLCICVAMKSLIMRLMITYQIKKFIQISIKELNILIFI